MQSGLIQGKPGANMAMPNLTASHGAPQGKRLFGAISSSMYTPQPLDVIRFGNTGPAIPDTPTLYDLFAQDTQTLLQSNPTEGAKINALRLTFFKTFKDMAPPVLMVSQFRRALDRFPLNVPSFMRWIPEGYVIKEFAKVGFDADALKAAVKKYDGMKGDKQFEALISYCDNLAKQNFKRFLNTDPAGNPPTVAGGQATPTLLQLLNQQIGAMAATDAPRAEKLTIQKNGLYNALGEEGSLVLVFAQYRKAMKKFPLPMPSFVMDFVVKEFASCGFNEALLKQKITQFDALHGDETYKDLLEYCTQVAKGNFRDFLKVPTVVE